MASRIGFAAVTASLCGPWAFAVTEGGGFERAVPAGVWAFVGCDDVTATLSELKASALGRLWFDAAMDGARGEVANMISGMRSEIAGKSAADPIELLDWVTGAAALVVFDHAAADPDFYAQGASVPRIGFLLGCGENAPKFVTRLNELLAPEVTAGRAALSTRQFAGTEVTVLREVKADDPNVIATPAGELAYAIAGDTVVLTIQPVLDGDKDEIDALLAGLAGDGKGSLASAPDYSASMAAQGPAGTGVRGYLDLGTIVRGFLASPAANNPNDPSSLQIATALGIDKLGRVSGRFVTGSAGTSGSLEMRIEGQTALGGILEKFFPTGELRSLARFTPDVTRAIAARVDLEAGIAALLAFLDEAAPDAAAQARFGMMMVSSESFDLQNDLLGPLGDEIGFAMGPVEDEMEALPGTEDDPASGVLFIDLADATKISAVLERFVEEQGLAAVRERSEFEGNVVTSVPTPLGLRAHYAILSDALVISPSLELLRENLRRAGEHELPTLATAPSFTAARGAIGDGMFTSLAGSLAAADVISQLEFAFDAFGLIGGVPVEADDAGKYAPGMGVTGVRVGAAGILMQHRYIAPKR
jgi:hypothetical protein